MTARPGSAAAVRERRRHHRWPVEIFGRLVIGGTSHHARTIDLSLGGALVAAVKGAVPGTYGQLELPSLGSLRCRIVTITSLGCHLAFEHEGSPPVASRTSPMVGRRLAGSVPPHVRAARNSSTPAL